MNTYGPTYTNPIYARSSHVLPNAAHITALQVSRPMFLVEDVFARFYHTAQWLDFQPQQVKKNSFYPSVIRYPIQLKALKLTQHPRLSTTTIHFAHTIITTYRSYTHQHRITAQRVTHTRLAPCSIDCFWCFRFISHFSPISQQFVSLSIQHMNALLRLTFNNNLISFFLFELLK